MSHQLSAGWFQERAGFCTGSHTIDLLLFVVASALYTARWIITGKEHDHD
jgi:hypothetical protein